MLLGVDNQEAVKSKIKSVASSLSYSFNKENILNDGLNIHDDSLDFTLLDNADIVKTENLLKEINGLNVQREGMHYTISFTSEEVKSIENFALLQAVETIRNRLDQFGLAEPTVAKQGEDKILVELAGIKTKEDELRAKERITKAAHLQLMEVDDSKMSQASNMSDAEAASYGLVLV
ncbi:protein translocase subunit SecD, partial [Campylobacter coli]|nr:protein translocase subunit SecD [Campylobacter coli]